MAWQPASYETSGDRPGSHFLLRLGPYYRQIAGLLVVGSLAGIVMNVAIVLPAVFLGRAINTVLAYHRHSVSAAQVAVAAGILVQLTGPPVRAVPTATLREVARVGGKPKVISQRYLGKASDIEAAVAGSTAMPDRTRGWVKKIAAVL